MFEDLKIPFEVIPADIAEQIRKGESPEIFACRIAEEKGMSVAEGLAQQNRFPWIVAADTVVVLDREVLGKPLSAADAHAMLEKLSGQTHAVITGWCVGRNGTPWRTEHTRTEVTFHQLSAQQIGGYVATGEGMDKAGAYAIQGRGTFLVDRIDGNYDNVVGLPISRVVRALISVGALPDFPLS